MNINNILYSRILYIGYLTLLCKANQEQFLTCELLEQYLVHKLECKLASSLAISGHGCVWALRRKRNNKMTAGTKDHKKYDFETPLKCGCLKMWLPNSKTLSVHVCVLSDVYLCVAQCVVHVRVLSLPLSLSWLCIPTLAFSFPRIYINIRPSDHEPMAVDRMSQGGRSRKMSFSDTIRTQK